jgi:hypothetical protein
VLKLIKFLKWLFGGWIRPKKKTKSEPNIKPYSKSLPKRWANKQWAKIKRKKKMAYQSRKFNSLRRRGKC